MVWEPISLADNCPSNAQFTACSNFGYVYLHLLVQLYGDSVDRRIQSRLKNEEHSESLKYAGVVNDFPKFDSSANNKRIIEKREHPWTVEDLKSGRNVDVGKVRLHESVEHFNQDDYYYKFARIDAPSFGDDKSLKEYSKDQIPHKEEEHEEYDFIVVGAGAAGCVVASRLTEHNFNVLLLEAGPEQPDVTLVPSFAAGLLGSNIIWMFRTQPDGKSCLAHADQRCTWPTGRTMGGGSAVNSLAYVRGNKLDYDTWAELGNVGWSYRDVLPFFKKSEKNLNLENQNRKYHGVDGPLTISRYPYIDIPSIMMTDAYNERGLPLNDYNGRDQLGTMQSQAFSQDGLRMSANTAFIQPIRYKRKNLTIKVESLAVEILIKSGKAYGVKYIKDGKLYKATAKKEVIVSAGPINSPKLLMLSGVGPKDHLHDVGIKLIKDLPVGYNLHDHVTFDGILIVLPNNTATTVSKEELIRDVIEFKEMPIKRGPLSGNGAVNSVSFIKTDPNLPAPNIQFQADVVQSWREYITGPSVYKSIPIFPSAFYDGILPRTMQVAPKSKGRLYLNSTNPYAYPVIFANYFGDKQDLEDLIKGVKFLLTLEDTDAFKKRGAYFYKESLKPCDRYKWGTDEYIGCMAMSYTSTPYHPVGTCKMGPEWDKGAVVNPRLKVYGIEGLRVIDSSIMPIVPRGNTNAPSIMVGERGVQIVLEDWGRVRQDFKDI